MITISLRHSKRTRISFGFSQTSGLRHISRGGWHCGRLATFPRRAVLRLRGQGLLLPSVVSAGLFFLVPLALLLVYSFGSVNLLDYQVYFGWTISNYTSIIRSIYLGVMLRSLALSLGATLACLLIGFPVAYTIARARG